MKRAEKKAEWEQHKDAACLLNKISKQDFTKQQMYGH